MCLRAGPAPSAGQAYAQRPTAARPPQVVSASEWGAVPPRAPLVARGPLHHLVLHHTAFATEGIGGTSFEAEAAHMRAIQRWHLDRGWATVGYHFVVAASGRIFRGRPVDRLGAHVRGHNAGTVGICLMGNFELERPTAAALASLDHVRARLIPGGETARLLGHREHRGHERSACPGRHLAEALRKRAGPPSGGPATPGRPGR